MGPLWGYLENCYKENSQESTIMIQLGLLTVVERVPVLAFHHIRISCVIRCDTMDLSIMIEEVLLIRYNYMTEKKYHFLLCVVNVLPL